MPLYKLGKFILVRKLNSGGMAEIYLAKSFGIEGTERLLAVKRILPKVSSSEEFIKMFIDEAKLASKLSHPNIAQIYELGKEGATYYIALELVDGKDLRVIFDKLAKSARMMPINIVCKVVADICEGLDYAHNKCDDDGRPLNIVHRDVSLQNVILAYNGQVKVIDFGVAKASVQSTETRAGVLKGKIGYMPPEQVAGQPVDRRGDIFAAGVILWELLTNCRLFKYHTEYQILERVRLAEIFPPAAINPAIPPELERIVFKALNRDPDARYANASELHDDLLAFLISRREMPSTREIEAFMQDLFAEEIKSWQLLLKEAEKIRPDEAGLVDLSSEAAQGEKEAPGPRVVRSEVSRPTCSLSNLTQQSNSQRSGTNYASGALSFFGQPDQTGSANATIQEVSSEALARLRASLQNASGTPADNGGTSALNGPTVSNAGAIDEPSCSVTDMVAPGASASFSVAAQEVKFSLRSYLSASRLMPLAGGLAVLLIIVAAVVFLLWPSGVGTLMIATEPPGISIGVDDERHSCDSPCTLPKISAGRHKLIIYMPGVEPVVRKVKVEAGGLTSVHIP